MAVIATISFQIDGQKFAYALQPGTGDGVTRPRVYVIGRHDNAASIAFAFDEQNAAHITLALNLLDAFARGDRQRQRELLSSFEKMKTDGPAGNGINVPFKLERGQ